MNIFNHLVIYLTEQCNLACTYCYIHKDYHSVLNFPAIKKAIDLFSNTSGRNKTFTFLGGEPFLAYPLLIKTIDYIIKCCQVTHSLPHIFLFTNGTKLTSLRIRELAERGIHIIISLDGKAITNDISRRFTKNYRYSVFNEVMRRVRVIPPTYLEKLEINMVVSPQTCCSLVDNIKFFYHEGFSSISPSPSAYSQWSNYSYKILESQLWELARFYISLFQQKRRLLKMYYIEGLINRHLSQMYSCQRLTLGADGNFYFCDAFVGVSHNKRLKYNIASVEEAVPDSLLKWINTYKERTAEELKKISPSKNFSLHKANLAIFCPFGVYHYTKVNGYEPKPFMRDFYKISELYTSVFWWIKEKLKKNEQFQKMYEYSKV